MILTFFGEKASYFWWGMVVIGRVLKGEKFTRRKLVAENWLIKLMNAIESASVFVIEREDWVVLMKALRVVILEWIFGDEKGWKFGEFSFADRMKGLG
jgi:hypothetical protein